MTGTFPTGIVGLLLRLALAVLVFLFVTLWPVPLILAPGHLGLAVPVQILWIIGFILAVLAFWRMPFWWGGRL